MSGTTRCTAPASQAHRTNSWGRRLRGIELRLSLVALVVGVAGSIQPLPSAAAASTSLEDAFLSRINHARAARDIPRLDVGGLISQVAREQARRMAERNRLFHNPQLTTDVTNWRVVGENVGYGPDALTLHQAFMQSSEHRANLLDRDYTRVGVGVVVRDGRVWVSEVFKTPLG